MTSGVFTHFMNPKCQQSPYHITETKLMKKRGEGTDGPKGIQERRNNAKPIKEISSSNSAYVGLSSSQLPSLFGCKDPSFISFELRLLNRSLEYCLDAFLQSVPAFIIAANSS